MTTSLVNCPLCSQPAFTSLASLSMCLVNVTTRSLDCPVCQDSLPGLDKFTIHIFGHALNHQMCHKAQQNGLLKVVASTSADNMIPIDIPVFIRHIDDTSYVIKDSIDLNDNRESIPSVRIHQNDEELSEKINKDSNKQINFPVSHEDNNNNNKNQKVSNISSYNFAPNHDESPRIEFQYLPDESKDLIKNLEPFLKCGQDKPNSLTAGKIHSNQEEIPVICESIPVGQKSSSCFEVSNDNSDRYPRSIEESSSSIGDSNDNNSCGYPKSIGIQSLNKNSTSIDFNVALHNNNNDNFNLQVLAEDFVTVTDKMICCSGTSKSGSSQSNSLMILQETNQTSSNHDVTIKSSSDTAVECSMKKAPMTSRDSLMTTQGVQTIEESFTKNNNPFSKLSSTGCKEIDSEVSADLNQLCSESASKPDNNSADPSVLSPNECCNYCELCLFSFPDVNILQMHKSLVHGEEEGGGGGEIDDQKKTFACHLCSKSFNMRGSLMVHRRVAHPVASGGPVSLKNVEKLKELKSSTSFDESTPQFSCKTCGKSFKKEQHLIQHERTHEIKQWECDVCSKVFSTKYFLKKHKRLHTGEMPYTCATCGKSFTFQQSYHKHLLYHNDEKPHVCGECGRAFKELSTLHNHQRIHTGEKPFSCESCGKCFRQRVSYLVHRRIHTGVMPYKCTICNKSFRYKVSERTHKCNNITPGLAVDKVSEAVEKLQKLEETISVTKQKPSAASSSSSTSSQISNPVTSKNNERTIQNDLNKRWETSDEHHPNKRQQTIGICDWTEITQLPRASADQLDTSADRRDTSADENIFSTESTDFLSFVLTPTFSPSEQFQHLTLSPDANRNQTTLTDSSREIAGCHSVNQFSSSANLETINEQSLKELLYSVDDFQ